MKCKFSGININNTLSWTSHVEKVLPKLSSACFAMKSIKPFVSMKILKVIYFAYFHSTMSYGIIFWGNSAASVKAFRMQKRIIRIMMASRNRDCCRPLFKRLGILPLPSMYIFALLRFVSQNRDLFVTNSEIHNINTRQHHDLHLPLPNLMKYQIGVFYRGIKLFNGLPDFLKKESFNQKKFLLLVKNFLCINSFYSLDKFYNFS